MRKSLPNLLLLFFLPIWLLAFEYISRDTVDREIPISIFDRLSEQEVLEITIRTDIDLLIDNKKSSSYHAAFINFGGSSDTLAEWRVELRSRGKNRNRVCDFPPLTLKFDHSVLGPENLKAYKTLKLVTHCCDRAETDELLQKEYLAYKFYNLITEQSFRVQLVRINWIDSGGKHQIGKKWGFFIENEEEMAQRLGGSIYDQYGVLQDEVNSMSAAQNSIFQYMIGNADWNLGFNKNIKLVKTNTSRDIIVVPYDFDFSGLVNAYFAVSEFGLNSIQERIYLGESKPEEINETFALFKSKKKDIMNLINTFDHISRSGRKDVRKYIQSFYSSLDEPIKGIDFFRKRIVSN